MRPGAESRAGHLRARHPSGRRRLTCIVVEQHSAISIQLVSFFASDKMKTAEDAKDAEKPGCSLLFISFVLDGPGQWVLLTPDYWLPTTSLYQLQFSPRASNK